LEHASAIPVSDLLCCPRCEGRLDTGPPPACAACDTRYPVLDDIPWLCPEPDAALGEWRGQLHALTAGLDAQAERYRAALTDDVSRTATRNRLKLLSAACQDHAKRLKSLLAPLLAGQPSATLETYRALSGALPAGQGLAGYYANLHRDWNWGDAENDAASRIVATALGDAPPGRMLVVGAGAGRLAYDLHMHRHPAVTVAADLNPLMLAVARRVFAGETVEMYEFPVAPRDLASHAVLRRLRAPAAASPGLHVVLADAARPPFARGAFDTVVTPWLIDILDDDLAAFAARVHDWLRPGGRWVNTGSLFFQHADPARCYSTEEVLDIVHDAGFDSIEAGEQTIPYLASPASRHARQERLFTFGARRDESERPAPATRAVAPDWLVRSDLPVPLLPDVASHVLSMRVHAFVGSLVDGRRTLRDIAAVLVRERLMTAEESEPAVRAFLRRLFDDAQTPLRR
jgi:hypothetical protein